MQALYVVDLDENERIELKELLHGGSGKVRKMKRAQILLAADQGKTDKEVAESIDAGTASDTYEQRGVPMKSHRQSTSRINLAAWMRPSDQFGRPLVHLALAYCCGDEGAWSGARDPRGVDRRRRARAFFLFTRRGG